MPIKTFESESEGNQDGHEHSVQSDLSSRVSDVDSNDKHDAAATTRLQAYKLVKCKDKEIKQYANESNEKNSQFKFELNMLEYKFRDNYQCVVNNVHLRDLILGS